MLTNSLIIPSKAMSWWHTLPNHTDSKQDLQHGMLAKGQHWQGIGSSVFLDL